MARSHIGSRKGKHFRFELNNLTRHAAILGTTGSGKTVMGKVLMEEALMKGIPVIAIDPKGDLGNLGLANPVFDFRPFLSKSAAERTANNYRKMVDNPERSALLKVSTRIYTPKSNAGIPVSLLPEVSAPKGFNRIISEDPNLLADFVEPVSESILNLAGISRSLREKAQSLLSNILMHEWGKGHDLDIRKLIGLVQEPPFTELGGLDLESYISSKERKKIASNLNLILTSPAKKAWATGDSLDVKSMLKKNNLSVFDLRFSSDKSYVVEQLLQELYRSLVRGGGSQRLRYLLYVDELAGLLPPPPANPPSKRLLELLIRQARAFGLGIVLATQSPGDVDYRLFGNLGTRFIGKLRTARDVEKVATATGIPPGKLKDKLQGLKTGDFVVNDSINNSLKLIHGRWLYSYHGGPLKPKEIAWINNPGKRPAVKGKLKQAKKDAVKKKSGARINVNKLLDIPKEKKQSKKTRPAQSKVESPDALKPIVKQVKKHADKTTLRVVIGKSKVFVPHLRIVIEPKPRKPLVLRMQGPYVFDLTSKSFPIGNYLKGITTTTFLPEDHEVIKHRANVEKVFRHAISDAKAKLKDSYFESALQRKYKAIDRISVENNNHALLMETIRGKLNVLDAREKRALDDVRQRINRNNASIRKYSARIRKRGARQILRKLTKKKTLGKTKEIRLSEKRIRSLKNQNKRLQEKLKTIKKDFNRSKEALKHAVFRKAHSSVKERRYNPPRSDLKVHATIILVPKNQGRL